MWSDLLLSTANVSSLWIAAVWRGNKQQMKYAFERCNDSVRRSCVDKHAHSWNANQQNNLCRNANLPMCHCFFSICAPLITGTWCSDHWSYLAGITRTPLATHPRAHQVQSGMPGSPVAVRAGASLLGQRLPSRVRQHSALSAVSWRFDLRGATNTQQLWRQNFCSGGTSPVELSSSPAAQSRHHLRTVATTVEGTPFSGM